MKQIKLIIQLAACAVAAILVTGCATSKAKVGVHYQPQAQVAHVAGAENVTVAVTVSDQRADKDTVGRKKNAYGMEMAAISATNDVAETLKNAIETELADRGFKLGAGNSVSVVAELSKFANNFEMHFWSGDAVAEVTMNVLAKNRDGQTVYSRLISVQGIQAHVQIASGKNAQLALDAALQSAVAELFNDPAFTDTLLKAGKPAGVTATP